MLSYMGPLLPEVLLQPAHCVEPVLDAVRGLRVLHLVLGHAVARDAAAAARHVVEDEAGGEQDVGGHRQQPHQPEVELLPELERHQPQVEAHRDAATQLGA